jgi:mannose-1-phosphate guanylyltransferase
LYILLIGFNHIEIILGCTGTIWEQFCIFAAHKISNDYESICIMNIDKFNSPEERDFINKYFSYCPNISIDYGVMEKADNVYMLGVDFGWADLGTWGSIFDIADKDENNNAALIPHVLLYEAENNIVALDDKDKLVVIQGLKDYIVADSGNVLMICKKEDDDRIKLYMTDAQVKHGEKFK